MNGKRNGKGKEYTKKHELIFEGEYLKGKRWAGDVKYKGEFFKLNNGNGSIKEYNDVHGTIFKWKEKWKRKRI